MTLLLNLCRSHHLSSIVTKTRILCLSKYPHPQILPPRPNLRSYAEHQGSRAKTRSRSDPFTVTQRPVGEAAFSIGQGAVAGGAALGLGALGYYGLGLSSQPGAADHASLWPDYVRDRVTTTYSYFGGSVVISAASAWAIFSSPALRLVSSNSALSILTSLAVLLGSGWVVQSIEYKPGFGAKQIAWAVHSAVVGVVLAPVCYVGGPVLLRAAWYTAGIVAGLSTVAACAPSEKFLNAGGPLAVGLGVVFAAALGSAFLPPITSLGAGLASISLYGGLLLFSGFLMYDTQKLIAEAERTPEYDVFDPVNASLHLYLDAVNLFIRLATMLSGGNKR